MTGRARAPALRAVASRPAVKWRSARHRPFVCIATPQSAPPADAASGAWPASAVPTVTAASLRVFRLSPSLRSALPLQPCWSRRTRRRRRISSDSSAVWTTSVSGAGAELAAPWPGVGRHRPRGGGGGRGQVGMPVPFPQVRVLGAERRGWVKGRQERNGKEANSRPVPSSFYVKSPYERWCRGALRVPGGAS